MSSLDLHFSRFAGTMERQLPSKFGVEEVIACSRCWRCYRVDPRRDSTQDGHVSGRLTLNVVPEPRVLETSIEP